MRLKAVLHVFREVDPSLVLCENHPDVDWVVSRDHDTIAANAPSAIHTNHSLIFTPALSCDSTGNRLPARKPG